MIMNAGHVMLISKRRNTFFFCYYTPFVSLRCYCFMNDTVPNISQNLALENNITSSNPIQSITIFHIFSIELKSKKSICHCNAFTSLFITSSDKISDVFYIIILLKLPFEYYFQYSKRLHNL